MSRNKKAVPATDTPPDTSIDEKPTPPADLWEQMDKVHEDYLKQKNLITGFTSDDYATRYNVGKSTARKQLNQMVQMKTVIVTKAMRNGHLVKVYNLVPSKSNSSNVPPTS